MLSKIGFPFVILIVQMLVHVLHHEKRYQSSQNGKAGSNQERYLVAFVRIFRIGIQDCGEDLSHG